MERRERTQPGCDPQFALVCSRMVPCARYGLGPLEPALARIHGLGDAEKL